MTPSQVQAVEVEPGTLGILEAKTDYWGAIVTGGELVVYDSNPSGNARVIARILSDVASVPALQSFGVPVQQLWVELSAGTANVYYGHAQ
jgi:hypothetical protein